MSHFSVLVFALVWTLVRCGCPTTWCTCKNYALDASQEDFFTVATCAVIPENVTQNFAERLKELTLLDLDFNDLHSVLSPLFPNLRRLSFRNSSISLSNFTVPLNLTHLDLANNSLDSWTSQNDLEFIRILDLSTNAITVLQDYAFRTLNVLEVLNVSFNLVSVLEPETFTDLRVLKCLDLSGNSLVKLTQKVFVPVTSLQYLNLSRNRLDALSDSSFDGLNKLQQLDLSWNNLQRLDPGSLELPSLVRLLLEGNLQLGNTSILVGTWGRKLQTVDASGIGLQQVPPSLTPSIRTLRLQRNDIKNINCGDLDSYPLLQTLDFASNLIDFIEEDALGRLDSLAMLFLSDNKIREIPKSLPERLEVLRMERNELGRIGEGDLQGLTRLEVLALNDNKIRIIEARAFSQLTSLVTLDLSRNPVGVLQPGCLQGPVHLQVLRLSGIDLISPAKDVSFPLSSPEHLTTLDLSKSPGLARQFLSDTAVLAASKRLQELDLSNTDSEVIRSDLLHYLPQLRSLPLEGNKLNCTNLRWLGTWMRRQDDRRHRDVACASPTDLWATPLVDLPDEEVQTTRENLLNTSSPPATDTNDINSAYSTKTNGVIPQDATGIISRTSYRAVTKAPPRVKTPGVKSRSSYTRVNDGDAPHRGRSTTLYVDVVPDDARHWNGKAHELSTVERTSKKIAHHPGMIILFLGILVACAVAATFKSRFTRRPLVARENPGEGMTSVTELW